MRLVLDTDVVVAGLRSPRGASAELLRQARLGSVGLLASVPMFIEYEAICALPEHMQAAQVTPAQTQTFLDALAAIVTPVAIRYTWRPQLRDPADEFVLEAAINGQADAVVSFNHRDFGTAPRRFGIELLLPAQALKRLRGE